jgi:hypothetical protein
VLACTIMMQMVERWQLGVGLRLQACGLALHDGSGRSRV